MEPFPKDIFTEPEPDPHTLRNLGPLTPLAGLWEGERGLDVHPAAEGTEKKRLHRAHRPAADRRADQRPADLLRPALPHAYRQAGRRRDVSRSGRLLAL